MCCRKLAESVAGLMISSCQRTFSGNNCHLSVYFSYSLTFCLLVIEIPRTDYWFFQEVVGLLGVTVGFPSGSADTTNQKLTTDQSDHWGFLMNWQNHSSKKKAVTVSPSLNNITLLFIAVPF